MPTGIAVPVRVSVGGGMRLVDGDENDQKTIAMALGSDDNENAFQQDIGLGDFMVFSVHDPEIRGKVMNRIRTIFKKFEAQKRFKLFPNTVRWLTDDESGEMTLQFKYLSIESDEEKVFSRTLNSEQ